ncbi:O-antigen ligase [Siphonobacter sp. SORGH_AS_0500]|uniref:O-antigen ligase family protein n=1 Tax=Siphonobacter sp. SORGH_AS_0500 TaxID=1864824 RepID=UPI001E426136|nr:O-antigen ligase family protein [Siphonobacter sp. SORGH_AS_0500]
MSEVPYPISSSESTRPTLRSWLRQKLWIEKFYNVPGISILLVLSLAMGWLTVTYGIVAGAGIIATLIGIPCVYAIVAKPSFGILVLLAFAYLLFYLMRFGLNFPLGTLMDGIQLMLILGFFIYQRAKPDWSVFQGRISTMIWVWIAFNFLEIVNPAAESRLAWVYTVRSVAFVMLMYFVFKYQIRTVQLIRTILKMWLLLAAYAAGYAFKQEYIGFSAAEEEWLHSDPNIANLLFIGGHWRKYSILSDPVAFSYNMVIAALICVALISGNLKTWKKYVLGVLIVFYMAAMLFSGTRGAYVLVPAGLAMFGILNYTPRVLQFSIVAAILMVILIFIPTSNQTLYRFQSAFKPSEDASFNLRKANQKRIQPYILSHPIGGGLGATGVWGQRFAPNSYLANFPPDSGYVRVAVEMGWIGLFLFCLLMFQIIRTGIINYYAIRNPELKMYCLAMTLSVFALNIGNYPQEAIVQFPSSIYIYLMAALIDVTRRLDQEEQKKLLAAA